MIPGKADQGDPPQKSPLRSIRLFPGARSATFVSRPNRFIIMARVDGRTQRTYLPNPGRRHEVLLPGCRLWLVPGKDGGKTTFNVVAVESPGGGISY